eukprot:166083_1
MEELEDLKKIDEAIERYYKSKGVVYPSANGKTFYSFAKISGFKDIQSIEKELDYDVDSMLVDFDLDNFPGVQEFKEEDAKIIEIVRIIKICVAEAVGINDDNKEDDEKENIFDILNDFKISQLKKDKIEKQYVDQCAEEFIRPIQKDGAFYYMLLGFAQCAEEFIQPIKKDGSVFRYMLLGKEHNCQYIQNLVDDYFRCYIEEFKKNKKQEPLTVIKWINSHPHFEKLKDNTEYKDTHYHAIKSAIKSFTSLRISQTLRLPVETEKKIPDSLEDITDWYYSVVVLINKLVENKENIPFQIDVCVAYKSKKDDMIGVIKEKLDSNKLESCTSKNYESKQETKTNLLTKLYNEFSKTPKNERLIIFIDHRSNEENVTIYAPPDDSRNIPKDAVPEWYFAASCACLIPSSKNNQKKNEED